MSEQYPQERPEVQILWRTPERHAGNRPDSRNLGRHPGNISRVGENLLDLALRV